MSFLAAFIAGIVVFLGVLAFATWGFQDFAPPPNPGSGSTANTGTAMSSDHPDHWIEEDVGPLFRRLSGKRYSWIRKLLVQSGDFGRNSNVFFGVMRNLMRALFSALMAAIGVYMQLQIYLIVFLGITGVVLGSWIPVKLIRLKILRRQKAIEQQLPEAIEILALQIEAGLGIPAACHKVTELLRGPLPDEFRRALQQITLGLPIQDAFTNMANTLEHPGVWELVDALLQTTPPGATLAQILRLQVEKLRGRKG
ncbi:MAG: type II secretion system F family protein [Candidatus Riflebacteria bacterium]|nr:type II secretion system F family protein [Candidatus Riflebacteria bacterium]